MLTVPEVASRLNISRASVYRHVWRKLHPLRLKRRTLFEEGELIAFIESLRSKEGSREGRGPLPGVVGTARGLRGVLPAGT